MKIHLVAAEMMHADGRTDGHDEVNGQFSQFCERTQNGERMLSYYRYLYAFETRTEEWTRIQPFAIVHVR